MSLAYKAIFDMKVIEVKDLTFSYNAEKKALDNISFDVEEGTYLSIIGPNGSGKSTLAKILMGLLPTKTSCIKLFGEEYFKKSIPGLRKHLGIVFQNPDNQFIATTVRDDIAFGLENREIPRSEMDKIILESAYAVGMSDYLDFEPQNLSGGQKQRVAIASTLALYPDIIIFDEATAMLDPKGKNEVYQAIEALRKKKNNLTVISITHDIEEAFLSDRIIALSNGKIVLDGTPSEIRKNPAKLKDFHLKVPFFDNLKEELFKRNVLNCDTYSIDELVEKLCQ